MTEELSSQEAAVVNRYTAWEGEVELMRWQETSSAGFKVILRLPSRQDLDAFDGVMKRRKGKAGHLYRVIFFDTERTGQELRSTESQFWGRNWGEGVGASLALHFDHADMIWWKDQKTRDQGDPEIEGLRTRLLMMELSDDSRLVDQAAARAAEKAMEPKPAPKPIGGAQSKRVAMWMQNKDTMDWLNSSVYRPQGPFFDMDDVDALLKKELRFASKAELDHDPELLEKFNMKFYHPCMDWNTRRGTQAY
jgi:hypothetical protein